MLLGHGYPRFPLVASQGYSVAVLAWVLKDLMLEGLLSQSARFSMVF